jgi:predicted signal transduction protein with EAL and GGDEF domain
VRAIDTTARLGGDEFAILFEDAEDEAAILARPRDALDSIARPIELGELDRGPLRLTACMGLALSAAGVDEDEVLRQADLALYHAKEHGKGRLVSYVPGMQSEMLRRHHLETALRDAIAREELHLLYQPVVSTRRRPRSRASRRWCAGGIPSAAWCRPRTSSTSPSRPD